MKKNDKKIKVLYIAGRIGITNGAYHSLLSSVMELMKLGVDPIVLLHKHGETEVGLKKQGIKCKVIPYTSCTVPANNPNKIKGIIKNIINCIADLRIKKFIKKEKIDLVHINVSTVNIGAVPALKTNTPIIWHLREFLETDVNMTYINKKKMSKLLCLADKVIAISNAVAKHFETVYGVKNIETIYNGISTSNIQKRKLNKKEKICFTIVGRIIKEKGQLDAVKAFELLYHQIANIELLIVGNVDNKNYYNEICEYIDKNNIKNCVNILEHKKDLKDIWNKTDIALICSKKEGFGRVTAEFMLNDIPVIGANTGGTTELLEGKRGILYEYGNSKDLAEKMKYAINNLDQVINSAHEALEYANKMFTAKQCALGISNIYNKVIQNNKGEKM